MAGLDVQTIPQALCLSFKILVFNPKGFLGVASESPW
jgi:hypothetical protein